MSFGNFENQGTRSFKNETSAHVYMIPNATSEDVKTGMEPLPLFNPEPSNTSSVLIDFQDRKGKDDTPFNYSVSTGQSFMRARKTTVSQVIVPKPPNINSNNNLFRWTFHDFGSGIDVTRGVLIPPGYYNATTFANALTYLMNESMVLGGYLPRYVVSFDGTARRFAITTSISSYVFYIVDNSTFVTKGINFVYFPSFPSGTSALASGQDRWVSDIASLLYTRYLYILSDSLTAYSMSKSLSSDIQISGNLICIVDITNIFTPEDFDASIPFTNPNATVDVNDTSPYLNLCSGKKSMDPNIDIEVLDEYGLPFSNCFINQDGRPNISLGVSMYLTVFF